MVTFGLYVMVSCLFLVMIANIYLQRHDIAELIHSAKTVHRELKSMGERVAAHETMLIQADKRLQEVLRSDPIVPASSDFLTCGGCGRVVPTFDGFAPVEHDCLTTAEKVAI